MSDLLQIIQVLTPLLLGGVIGSIAGLKWKVRSDRAKSKQEDAKAERENALADQAEMTASGMDIKNTADLIRLYKDALKDIQDYKDSIEVRYAEKLKSCEDALKEVQVELSNTKERLDSKDRIIAKLVSNQSELQGKIEILQSQLKSNCEQCEFRSECKKFIKLYEDSANQ
jgi:predicted nuclease with TOPRIM domain